MGDGLWVSWGDSPFRGGHDGLAPFVFRNRPLKHPFGNLHLTGALSAFLLFHISSLIMWWPPYCSQTRMWTATWSPGTGWCCCTVRWAGFHVTEWMAWSWHVIYISSFYNVVALYFLKESELFLDIPYLWHWFDSLKSGKLVSRLSLEGKLFASF